MSNRVSVRDVAAEAGVAIGTVSRVLNQSGYASRAVRQRVLDAVERLGYEPDFTARHMRTGHSKTIGYLLPNIANPFLAAHLSEVERLTQAAGYSLLVGSSERESRDRELLAFLKNRRLEAIIASPSSEYPDVKTCPFTECGLPVVIVDRTMGSAFDSVLIDHRNGLLQAMDYLIRLGHRRIALMVSSANLRPGREKLAGYKEALESADLPFDDSLVYMPNSWVMSSRDRMKAMLSADSPPTAVVALGTQMLSGAVHVAREAGMDVPSDLSVIGIGTMETLDLMYPPVTALRYPFARSAQLTVQLVMDRINGVSPERPQQMQIPMDLVLGKSCAPARAGI
jgi:LacI family transcriptional regulator